MRSLAPLAFAFALSACASSTPNPAPKVDAKPGTLSMWKSDANGFDTQTWFYDTGREVVVFDAQFTDAFAKQAIDAIRAKTASPIKWLVVTHPNPDKFNGASAFQAIGAKVVASKKTAAAIPGVHAYKRSYFVDFAKMFTADTYPKEAKVDVTFEGTYALPLDAGEVVLEELAHAGVSTAQTVAKIPALKGVIVGDLVHPKTHAWLEGGIRDGKPSPDVDSWIAALDELRPLAGWTIHAGRGAAAPVDATIPEQQAYLRAMRDLVRDYVASLSDKSVLSSNEAGTHWKEIAARASKAYPDYALPYMVEYGVYGLALSFAK